MFPVACWVVIALGGNNLVIVFLYLETKYELRRYVWCQVDKDECS
jgi:hypothetical protein